MNYYKSVLYCSILTTVMVIGVPTRRSTGSTNLPTWYLPCGSIIETEPMIIEQLYEEIKISLSNIKLQHQIALNDYFNHRYDNLYERVRIGLHEEQYIPNWVPGEKDVNEIKKLIPIDPRMIINNLPKFHMDLQKFAIAFEQLIDNETEVKILRGLRATQSYLMMMLCEIESNITNLSYLKIPSRIQRNIMSDLERKPPDHTTRMIRDWGVIHKYKNYLHAWKYVFDQSV